MKMCNFKKNLMLHTNAWALDVQLCDIAQMHNMARWVRYVTM